MLHLLKMDTCYVSWYKLIQDVEASGEWYGFVDEMLIRFQTTFVIQTTFVMSIIFLKKIFDGKFEF